MDQWATDAFATLGSNDAATRALMDFINQTTGRVTGALGNVMANLPQFERMTAPPMPQTIPPPESMTQPVGFVYSDPAGAAFAQQSVNEWRGYDAARAAYDALGPIRKMFTQPPAEPGTPRFTGDLADKNAIRAFSEGALREQQFQSMFGPYLGDPRVEPYARAQQAGYESAITARNARVEEARNLQGTINQGVISSLTSQANAINTAFAGGPERIMQAVQAGLASAAPIPMVAARVFDAATQQFQNFQGIYQEILGRFDSMISRIDQAVGTVTSQREQTIAGLYNDTADQIQVFRNQSAQAERDAASAILSSMDPNDPRTTQALLAVKNTSRRMASEVYSRGMAAYNATKTSVRQAYDGMRASLESAGFSARVGGMGAQVGAAGVLAQAGATVVEAGDTFLLGVTDFSRIVSQLSMAGVSELNEWGAKYTTAAAQFTQNTEAGLRLMGSGSENLNATYQYVNPADFIGKVAEFAVALEDRHIQQVWNDREFLLSAVLGVGGMVLGGINTFRGGAGGGGGSSGGGFLGTGLGLTEIGVGIPLMLTNAAAPGAMFATGTALVLAGTGTVAASGR